METNTLHPLVAKKAAEWVELATKYGVTTELEPMDKYWTGGVVVKFTTGQWMESGCVMIYRPSRRGRTVRQSVLVMSYRRSVGNRTTYTNDPNMTLRRLRDRIVWSWSPTARERLMTQAQASRAAQVRRAELEAAK